MKMKIVGAFICLAMMIFVSNSLMAATSGVGMVRPYGTAWLNGAAVERSSTIFPGDLVQTNSSSAMKINSSGSSVTVLSDSLVKFEGDAVSIQHGGVKLATSTSMVARAGSVSATPTSSARTEFEMVDVDGAVQIVALKGDLKISNGSETTILPEGQRATQKDSGAVASKQNKSVSIPAAQAGFVLAAAGTGFAEAGLRSLNTLNTATAQTLETPHPDIAIKTISPKKP